MQNVGKNANSLAILVRFVAEASAFRLGWYPSTIAVQNANRLYACNRAKSYQDRHLELIGLAHSNPDAQSLMFDRSLDYVDFTQVTVTQTRFYTDEQVRKIQKSGTQWARSYGTTLVIAPRVPISE